MIFRLFLAEVCMFVHTDTDMDAKACSHTNTGRESDNNARREQRLCFAAAAHSDPWHTVFPLHWAARIRGCSPFIPLPADAHTGAFRRLWTHTYTNSQWHTHIYCASCWQWSRCAHDGLGSVCCLVLIWLHKFHQHRGFTLNRIFWGFLLLRLHTQNTYDPFLRRQARRCFARLHMWAYVSQEENPNSE